MNNTILSILAGLGGMFGWGSSDFLASQFSEKIGHSRAFFYSQLVGLLLVGLAVLVMRSKFSLTPILLIITCIAGVGFALGYLFFYAAFEKGNISVVSAVVNLQNVAIIAIAYFFYGQRISGIQVPAIVLLLLGVTLVSLDLNDLKKGKMALVKGVKESAMAAVMFGVFFWPLNQYVVRQTDWLAVNFITKLVAILTVLLIAMALKWKLSLETGTRKLKTLWPIAGIGLLDTVGVLSVSGGLSVGNAIIINPISSALTVVTVGLAVIFLHEKLTKIQILGILATVTGIVLMSLGS